MGMTKALIDAALLVGGIGLFCGMVLSVASHFLGIKEDPRVEAVARLLPGINCGACGFAGCIEYAKAIVLQGAKVTECKAGGQETAERIAALMGVKAEVCERKVAIVLCGGDDSVARRKFIYNGIADCAAAELVGGGDKACSYGCLGLGSCARVCPMGAIDITSRRLAVVHPELCIGCGLCVDACPRHLIKLVPESRSIHVLCSSREKGAAVRKKCSVGCIGCSLCARQTDAIRMEGALAVVDYDKPLENEDIIAKCPQHTIVKRSGRKAEAAA
jgi:Na+-translocating ferredoxin:NAD+ oxidoreductase subunit B